MNYPKIDQFLYFTIYVIVAVMRTLSFREILFLHVALFAEGTKGREKGPRSSSHPNGNGEKMMSSQMKSLQKLQMYQNWQQSASHVFEG